ncbi:MAG: OmpA family protein, partial [Actinomycetota bacterium]
DAVLDVLAQVDDLRSQGLDAAGIAEAMEARGAPVPAGGRWSVSKVERILEAFDDLREETDETAPAVAVVPADASGGPDGSTGHLGDDRPDDRTTDDADHAAMAATAALPGLALEPMQGRAGRGRAAAIVRWAAVIVALAALGAGGFLALDAITGSDGGRTELAGEESADSAAASPTTVAPNPADTMAIRIETDQEPSIDLGDDADAEAGDDDDGGQATGLAPPTATIKADGLLYVEGAFANEADAKFFVDDAAEVFGRENIVEAYVVDAAAPEAKVTDVALDKPVLFETGTAVIHPDYIAFLEACAGVLELNPHIVMSVAAYTDSVGSEEFNLELSQRRAQAIVDFYREREIGDDQLLAAGFGEANPVATNDDDEGRSQNRRAMLELLNVVGDEAAAVSE